MSSKRISILRKRKEKLLELLKQIDSECENIKELVQEIPIEAASMISGLDEETDDEYDVLQKYRVASMKLEEWLNQISRLGFDLDMLMWEENQGEAGDSTITSITTQDGQMVRNIPFQLEENDILDMRFVSGDSPHDFWLRFYSTKELEIKYSIRKLFEAKKLQPVKEMLGGDVCVCNGCDYFRARIINKCTDSLTSFMVLNVDNGDTLKVEKDQIYRLTEELAILPVQAIHCCLEGDLGKCELWDACAVKLFHKVMEGSSLVVTICSVPFMTCSKFVVKMDVHNEMRVESKIDLNSWITHSVLPALIQKRTSKSADTLKSLFDFLCSKVELESNASLKANNMTSEPGSKTRAAKGRGNKYKIVLCAKENANDISNSSKEKPYMHEPLSRDVQHHSCFLCLSDTLEHSLLPYKDSSDVQQSPLSAVASYKGTSNVREQSSSPVCAVPPHKENSEVRQSPLSAVSPHKDISNVQEQCSSSVYTMPPHKDISNMQEQSSWPVHAVTHIKEKPYAEQQSLSAEQQTNAFLNHTNPPLLTIPPPLTSPHFLMCQNPPKFSPLSPVDQPVYSYAPVQPQLLVINPFHNAMPSAALQQHNQSQSFQYNVNSPTRSSVSEQYTSQRSVAVNDPTFLQSDTEGTQKGGENKQKEAVLITNTLHTTLHQMETPLVTKQMPSIEAASFGEDFTVTKEKIVPPDVNSKSTDKASKKYLRYPDLKFKVGERYQAFVVHINNPDDFYIHVAHEHTAFIETLDQEITENYKTCSFKFKNKEQAKMILHESYCAVFYEDGQLWHRGKVVNWMNDSATALEVQYVDYGEVREVDLSMIKPLKEEFTKLPICATRCKLANIRPAGLPENREHIWAPETSKVFRVMAVSNKLHSIVVTNISSDAISVLLVTEDKTVINKVLVNWGYAKAFKPIVFDPSLPIQLITENVDKEEKFNSSALDNLLENCQKEKMLRDSDKAAENCRKVDDTENILENWNPMADDYFSVDNTEYHDDENACYVVAGYVPQDEQRLCKFYAKKGRCFKGVTCTKEHSLPNPDGWTTDRETVLQNPFNILDLPPDGTFVTVKTTAIYKLNMFYAHIHWKGRIKEEEEEEETLLTLNRCINKKDNVSKMKRPHIIPAVGQLVLARFVANGSSNFFRARVIDTSIEKSKVQVVYTDYGNTEWVSEKDIREIEPQYLHLPFQAIECYISNVRSKTNSKEALLYLSDLILGRQLVGKLVSKNVVGHAEIELWVGDQKVSDILIEKDYAEYREAPIFVSEGAYITPG